MEKRSLFLLHHFPHHCVHIGAAFCSFLVDRYLQVRHLLTQLKSFPLILLKVALIQRQHKRKLLSPFTPENTDLLGWGFITVVFNHISYFSKGKELVNSFQLRRCSFPGTETNHKERDQMPLPKRFWALTSITYIEDHFCFHTLSQ